MALKAVAVGLPFQYFSISVFQHFSISAFQLLPLPLSSESSTWNFHSDSGLRPTRF